MTLLYSRYLHHPLVSTGLEPSPRPVEILRQVWVQQYARHGGYVVLAVKREEMPPAAKLIQSPFDLEVHYSRKQAQRSGSAIKFISPKPATRTNRTSLPTFTPPTQRTR